MTKACITLLVFILTTTATLTAHTNAQISGKIISTENEAISFATVYLKGTTNGSSTDDQGIFHIKASAGKYTLVVSAIGYKTIERDIDLKENESLRLHLKLKPEITQLEEITITSSGVSRLKRSAFNAVAVDAKALHNSTQNLSEALAQAPGLKLRESGGVGSDMQFMMDGFSGKHVKIFIDGVPQEGVGSAFSINNIPINFAERIEVYKGVVPVGFGSDALGGVINIVTNKKRRKWFADASYTYGSFNTHKSYVNFGQSFKNGLTYEINAFQNYSDNNYYIDTPVEHFNEDGSTSLDATLIERVRRFNDTYHNEAITGKLGITGKNWADRLMFGFTYSQFYKEIQNGVIQKVVFGEKFRKGYSIMPSAEYSKRNFLTKGLHVSATINYNNNLTQIVDTSAYRYNWLGEKKYQNGQLGEQTYQDTENQNNNWNATVTANYHIGHKHLITFNHVWNAFDRQNTSAAGASGNNTESENIAKKTRKNISGVSYRVMPSERWNLSLFGKYYSQYNSGPASTSESGTDQFIRIENHAQAFGYGAAGSVFILKGVQTKLSYERAYRLPTNEELFGDEDLELGQIGLKPEKSDNINLNVSLNNQYGKHNLYVEGGLIYRNTTDFIQRRIGNYSGNKTYATYENHGKVKTKGFNVSARYGWNGWISVGGNFTRMDVRDNVKTISGGTEQESLTYGARIPNQPYMFANSDIAFNWRNCLKKGNTLTVNYDNLYMHSFPLYSENLGSSSSKNVVPTQLSHNISIGYSIHRGKYNFSLECRNLTNEKLYDNFSLQKAGRAFYGKVRICFGDR